MTLRTRLAYKAEHVIDLKTEAIIEAEIYHANEADTATLVPSLEQAQGHPDEASDLTADIKKAVFGTGYHAAGTLAAR
jgi:transposase